MRKIILLLPMVLLSACSSSHKEAEIQKASLNRTLIMTDNQNVRYGTVELDAMGGGRMYDVDGRLIGTIVATDIRR